MCIRCGQVYVPFHPNALEWKPANPRITRMLKHEMVSHRQHRHRRTATQVKISDQWFEKIDDQIGPGLADGVAHQVQTSAVGRQVAEQVDSRAYG
ncbi:hypothetical protein SDC9_176264 [bioreactor metagenome]|uniref:Uncharacterized protein n=1 Tax=bioreactor metagenome TaxID=1076179 RepID=A0A645GSM9_9ZZZZ